MGLSDDVRGAAIPFRLDNGSIAWESGIEKLRQNLRMLLATRIRERPMQRDFGTKIPSLVHEPDDDALGALIESQAREAMLRWEPRLIVVSTAVERKDGALWLRLDYVHVDQAGGGQIVVSVA
jgi:phage baseplate assembly protein W